MRRAIVTGARGLLGRAATQEAARRGLDVVGVAHESVSVPGEPPVEALDVTDEAAVRAWFSRRRADVVLHLAAITDVDRCEEKPAEAHRLHVDATAVLAECAKALAARFVYVSTDSVFDGSGGPYDETSKANPLNVYARTKLEGEGRALEAAGALALVVRTNFFGARGRPGGRSLAEWGLKEMAAGHVLQGFTDVRFNPLWTGHLAASLFDLAATPVTGVVHVASPEAVSKHEFLMRLAREFRFDPALVSSARQGDRVWRAKRPLSTVLDVRKAELALGRPLPDLSAGLRAFRESGTWEGRAA